MKKSFSEKQLIQMAQQQEAIMQSQENFLKELDRVMKETIISIESLKEVQKKPGKIYVKLGPGIMIEAEIKNTEKCKRAFSEKGYKEANIKETIKWLEKRLDNVKKQVKKVSEDYNKSRQQLNNLIGILKQIQAEKQKNISGQ
jgi:prefoldin subunit 5